MSVFAGPLDRIDREVLEVMVATCADELAEIQELWLPVTDPHEGSV